LEIRKLLNTQSENIFGNDIMNAHRHKELHEICKSAETAFPGKYKVFKLTCLVTGESYIGSSQQVYKCISALHREALRYGGEFLIHKMIRQFDGQFTLEILDSDDDQLYVRDTLVPLYISFYNTHRAGLNETSSGRKRNIKHSGRTKKIMRLIAIRDGRKPPKLAGWNWYTNGFSNIRIWPGNAIPEGYRPGQHKEFR
jgi:hypothetical protein